MSTKIYFRHDEFRKGQKDIVKDIYENISLGKNMLMHAPTGVGKTDSALSPAISLSLEKNLKVLFLTPKISQHRLALDVIEDINQKYNLNIKAIDFVGKKNMCIDPGISKTESNFYEVCQIACKKRQCPFFENIKPSNKAQREILSYSLEKQLKDKTVLTHLEIKEIAENLKTPSGEKKPVCAYELAKVYAKSCKVIIADYYHAFSPKIMQSTLNDIGITLNECIIIVDEAHNLEDRLLKLMSKTLNTNLLHRAIKETKDIKNNKLKNLLEKQLQKIEELADNKLTKEKEVKIKKEEILLEEIKEDILYYLEEIEETGLRVIEELEEDSSSLIGVGLFLEEWIKDKDAHIRYIKKERNITSVKYNALDITPLTKNVFENCYASVIMSATLTPLTMYQNIFGLTNAITKEYPSPFDKEKRLNLLITDSTTKFTERSNKEYLKIARHIENSVNNIPGNCVVFFPSFEMLNEIVPLIGIINKPVHTQKERMFSKDFEEMIRDFKRNSKRFGSVLFSVMGGKASEGIDLPGEYLIGAVIVGIPLAKPDIEVNAKISYYDVKYKNGWSYAYIQPAIQKVIQSAGRVIRTQEDKGVVVFIDSRFHWDSYRKCFSKDLQFVLSKNLSLEIENFFKN